MLIIVVQLTNQEFQLLKQNDPELIRKFFQHYKKIVYNFLLIKTRGNREITDEVFSDTFHSVLLSIPTLKTKDNIKGWVLTIVSRRLCDYFSKVYRIKKHEEPQDAEPHTTCNNPIDSIIQKEEELLVKTALDRIPLEYKKLIQLKYIEKKKRTEIAEILNKSEDVVRGLLYRAKKSLLKEIKSVSRYFD